VFLIAFISGLLPAKIKGCGKNPVFMGLANAFSGGLFLAIALVHILPEVTQEYNEYIEEGHDHNHTHTTVTLMQSANQVLVQHGNHYHLVDE
jgi:zinc transporter 1/2/3